MRVDLVCSPSQERCFSTSSRAFCRAFHSLRNAIYYFSFATQAIAMLVGLDELRARVVRRYKRDHPGGGRRSRAAGGGRAAVAQFGRVHSSPLNPWARCQVSVWSRIVM